MNSPYFTATLAQQRRAELETQARRHRMVHGGGRPDVTHADPAPGVVRRRSWVGTLGHPFVRVASIVRLSQRPGV